MDNYKPIYERQDELLQCAESKDRKFYKELLKCYVLGHELCNQIDYPYPDSYEIKDVTVVMYGLTQLTHHIETAIEKRFNQGYLIRYLPEIPNSGTQRRRELEEIVSVSRIVVFIDPIPSMLQQAIGRSDTEVYIVIAQETLEPKLMKVSKP